MTIAFCNRLNRVSKILFKCQAIAVTENTIAEKVNLLSSERDQKIVAEPLQGSLFKRRHVISNNLAF